MPYKTTYNSAIGKILLAANNHALTGLWFYKQKHFASKLQSPSIEKQTPILKLACDWLDIYFSGKNPEFTLPIYLSGTPFEKQIWQILVTTNYGKTITYGKIAQIYAQKNNLKSMSAQAVGGAVSRNPLSIIVPCHRVIGSNQQLTGYAGGIDKKVQLLRLEGVDVDTLKIPKSKI